MQTESRFAVGTALITAKISSKELSQGERQTQSKWELRLVGEGQAKECVTDYTKGALGFTLYLSGDAVSGSQALHTAPLQTRLGITGAFPQLLKLCHFCSFVFNIPFSCKIHYSGFHT